jgi:tRNA pseudouridine65 synthase/23S rRNA pseudouridine1911/1915/1917 synthase
MQNFKSKTCIETHIVKNLEESIRLQEYAITIFEAVRTKSALKKRIKKGLVSINGELAKTSDWIENGQVLSLYTEEIQHQKKVFELQLEVVYEDDHLAVVNKSQGFPTNGNYFKTIENALPFNLKPSNERDRLPYPQPVHRLDNPTSGVLLIAKTQICKSLLSVMFEENKVQKQYCAIAEGHLEPKKGTFNFDIDEKPSFSRYEIEQLFQKNGKGFSLVTLWPQTGRTHQLRIHLSSAGHPIVGDEQYGSSLKQQLLLHARSIQFEHPITHKSYRIETEIPHKFVKFIHA